ncbi:helix-turn-helix domain-containing protein [Algoriphagus halophytocola]|uniref:Helix-turn-helix domain-containing protein n=1 Tax=Algoriphagus halophytocola TaxID=2991499 RepID=A0ABY6MII7_9BACT|nr:helix-turn-helix domain-containing protein [Algoriphagus sp. TR-M5]UZD23284.1 helix-turn-helix domain-containing protein [Algoriphagus sp. TR-M5]
MPESPSNREDFISQATALIVENASNEQFGVSELADAMNMSRSNLLRKIKSATSLSASLFIRQIRLEIAMDLLKEGSHTVSEVSYQVGFGSSSYFIKCFREHFGFPPGEVGKQQNPVKPEPLQELKAKPESWPKSVILASVLAISIMVILAFYYLPLQESREIPSEKSIAVLPFKNESSDSSNLYFVNGLMESTLNNLQKIKDLRVISRSSVDKYRNTQKSLAEIADELQVSYFVTGSGQKVGDQVLLNIQLIEASGDRQLWAEQYNREFVDIFSIQNEVAMQIATSIEALVTPTELQQIEKKPTEDLLAYDYYLQGLDPFLSRTTEGLNQAIGLFEKAIAQDPEFALAYADIAISYYLLEMFQAEKQYTEQINSYADKALLYDSKSAESLCAKAFYYIQTKEYTLAQPYLKKALEYNPNSALAIQMLADFYFRLAPDTEKYLEYALKGVRLQVVASDSTTQSYSYLQLANALVSAGFVDEALIYINRSLDFDPNNYYAPHLRAFILFAKDGNIPRTQKLLKQELKKDPSRLDILQDLAKLYYTEEEYDSAFQYFQTFVQTREAAGLDIYRSEDIKIGMVYEKVGHREEAEKLYQSFDKFCETDQSVYKNLNLAMKYTHKGDLEQAMDHLRQFSEEENYLYWFLLIGQDPIFQPLTKHPDFDKNIQKIKDKFWEKQARIEKSLEEEGLI